MSRRFILALAAPAIALGLNMGTASAEPMSASAAASAAAKAWYADRVAANAQGARREANAVDRTIRTYSGVSMRDIRKHGWRGGRNSFIRKPFG